MNNIVFAFLVTTVAGLSTMLGIIPIYIKFKDTNKLICIALAFASGIMFSVSINSLVPESYNLLKEKLSYNKVIVLMILFFLIGVLLTSFIDKVFKKLDNKLYKIGIINMLALMIHNIPEGILTFSTTTTNISLGLTLALSIMFHNIPEGLSISIPIYYSTNSRRKAVFYTAISGFSEVFGAILTYLFLFKYINNYFIGIILSLTTGIMIYISIFELLKNSLEYKKKRISYIFFLIGFIFMIFFK
ncbi:MAG: ZIP family metal transporter [bacterium]|nr:ZIP family metal transporter [bacterium]